MYISNISGIINGDITTYITGNISGNITGNTTHHTSDNGDSTNYIEFNLYLFLITMSGAFIILIIYHRSMFGSWWILDDIKACLKKNNNRVTYEHEEYIHDRIFITPDNYSESENESESKSIKITIKEIPTFSNQYPTFCSICQEEKLNTLKTDCDHYFCEECITEYIKIKDECPNCKSRIISIYKMVVTS